MTPHPLCKSLTAAHHALKEILQPGDCAIDATMGNGHDTLFLAQCLSPVGTLYAFDVQQQALDNTKKRLIDNNIPLHNIQLHLDSHAHLGQYVHIAPKAIVFNLGYLPGSDKNIITHAEDTLTALNSSTEILLPGGLLSVLCYPGHCGGNTESEKVTQFFKQLPHRSWLVTQLTPLNVQEHIHPPFLILAQKLN